MADIFISYARSTELQAKQVEDALSEAGYSVWRDDVLPAHRAYSEEIETQLDTAKAVVVIWSAEAAKSEWVRSEADRARHERKLVQVTVDGSVLPMPFDQIQCADLVGWTGNRMAGGWRKLTNSVAALCAAAVESGDKTSIPKPAETVLAVLPFDNLSTDPEMQFFSDGVSEEIIQRLSRGAGLTLIGRTSSFQFRGERKSEAARSLHCSHILDGSIRRAANRVRVSAQLAETASGTALWSERYDRDLEDIFAVQDDISENIAAALNQQFSGLEPQAVEPAVYDLYLRASLQSYAPEELRANIGLLEAATRRAPHFAEAWGRLAYLRAWLRFYQPYPQRAASTQLLQREAERALAVDPQNVDALVALYFDIPPFGRFPEVAAAVDRIRRTPGTADGKKFCGWALRHFGHIREALVEDERSFLANPLDTMCANTVALARMAAGRFEEAAPVYEDLLARVPDMSFPYSSLLRCRAFLGDWSGVDELLAMAPGRPVREFEDTLRFVRTRRDPNPENIGQWRREFDGHIRRTGSVDMARLVYTAHLGLVEEAYRAAGSARLGPTGSGDDIMGPDAYRTSLLFQQAMPELRDDPRFVNLCARLGLVEYWVETGRWPDCADTVPYDFRAECEKARDLPVEDFGF